MGIPRFYRYMSERYPLLNQPISDVSLLPDFDCFYLDMNGIIHNCTHSDDAGDDINSLSSAQQLQEIFNYIDRLVTHIIKPKKLLYLAIDGVAPRAKLNQQRSRRFRAGMERQEHFEKEKRLYPGETIQSSHFDSNAITPGTEFLADLSRHLIYFVRQKMKIDPLWQRLEVYFSGSEVPGEGEHKIVEFIRTQKMASASYEPNLRHCMYGSDADLMLLGLMTHEPHFTLVRELVVWGGPRRNKPKAKPIEEQKWQLVHLSLFREYLMLEMNVAPETAKAGSGQLIQELPTDLDGERMLDDFILLTFLLGNDFIPHSPTLEISEDAIPLLLREYRQLLDEHKGDYLTRNGELTNIPLLQKIFQVIGSQEEDIMNKRAQEQKMKKGHQKGKQHEKPRTNQVDVEDEEEKDDEDGLYEALEGDEVAQLGREYEAEEMEVVLPLTGSTSFQETKWAYYERKFGASRGNESADNSDLRSIKKAYLEALKWCLSYYFQGPPSWSWYFPYHYAPMISDLTGIQELLDEISFEKAQDSGPLLPFEQLMANLPASSAHLLPAPYRHLMTSETSPIKHFYPFKFEVDMEGKRNAWEGVNLLPFIDADLLKSAIRDHCPPERLSKAEQARNKLQPHALYITFDPRHTETLASTLPQFKSAFPDVEMCMTRTQRCPLPPAPAFESALVPGVQLPTAGFPSLFSLPLQSYRTACVDLNVFGMKSRKATSILKLPPLEMEEGDVQRLIGKDVLVNYPNLHAARVVGTSTMEGAYRRVQKTIEFTPHDTESKGGWSLFARRTTTQLLSGSGHPGTGGLNIGDNGIQVAVHVLPLQGMVTDAKTGALRRQFGTKEAVVPLQLVVTSQELEDDRYKEVSAQSVSLPDRFPLSSKVLITSGKWLGCSAIVQDIQDGKVQVQVQTIDQEPPFGYTIAHQMEERYFASGFLAKKTGLSPTVLGVLTGGVLLKPGGYDIGLNLKYRKELMLPGFSRLVEKAYETSKKPSGTAWRRGDIVQVLGSNALSDETYEDQFLGVETAWEYSIRTLHLLQAFQQAYPGVLERLSQLPFDKSYATDKVLGTKNAIEAERMAEDIRSFISSKIRELGGSVQHVPVTSVYMSAPGVQAVEMAGALSATERKEREKKKAQTVWMAPSNLFRPNPLVNQDLTGCQISAQKSTNKGAPRLGDRVINLSTRGVPLGHRGTVVATHESSKCVEVLFDEGFRGGEAIAGCVAKDKGKVVPWNNLLCVSHPPRTPARDKARPVSAPAGKEREAPPVTSNPAPPNASTSQPPVASGTQPSAPIPPAPAKLQQVLKKWDTNAEETPPQSKLLTPSVAAFFSKAQEAETNGQSEVANLFPHNYAGPQPPLPAGPPPSAIPPPPPSGPLNPGASPWMYAPQPWPPHHQGPRNPGGRRGHGGRSNGWGRSRAKKNSNLLVPAKVLEQQNQYKGNE